MWAFCVGVQAEDVGCLPSPRRPPMRTPPLPPQAPAHLTHGGSALVGWLISSRGIHTLEGRAFTFLNISGVQAYIPHHLTPLQPHRPEANIRISKGRGNPGPPPRTVQLSGPLCPEVLSISPRSPLPNFGTPGLLAQLGTQLNFAF